MKLEKIDDILKNQHSGSTTANQTLHWDNVFGFYSSSKE